MSSAPFDFDALLASVAWETTSMGRREDWPRSLHSMLALLARSPRPQYVVWGPERRFFYNEPCLPVMGIKHPAGFGQPMAELWAEVWEDIGPLVDTCIDDGVSHFLEDIPFVLRRHGFDELTYFSFSYTPVEDDTGRVAGLSCVLSERTQEVAEIAGWRAEIDRLHRLFKQAPGFICVTHGPTHEFALVNDAYVRLAGPPREALLGRPVAEALPEMSGQGYVELLDRVFATGEAFSGQAMPVHLARGEVGHDTRYVDFVYQPIHDADGTVSGIFTQGVDVTDQVRAEAGLRASEQALREANARKDRFLAVLGHELRNPLAPIQTATELLRMMPLDERAVQCVDVIARQARQMSTLVEDLLDISRIVNGLITLRRADIDVNTVVLDAVEQLRGKADERGHDVTIRLAPGCATVHGDGHRLTQVVSNLFANSIRYTAPGGKIGITVARCDDGIRVDVVDDGEGIAAELMPQLFVPFSQQVRSADRAHGGLGLGLALVKSLVEAHGGRIEVDSAGRGAGSRFTVVLPTP